MTANNKTYKTGRPSAFATVFSCRASFPCCRPCVVASWALQALAQKHLVGETHPLWRSLLNPLFKSPRSELSGNSAVPTVWWEFCLLQASPGHAPWWEGACWATRSGLLQELGSPRGLAYSALCPSMAILPKRWKIWNGQELLKGKKLF